MDRYTFGHGLMLQSPQDGAAYSTTLICRTDHQVNQANRIVPVLDNAIAALDTVNNDDLSGFRSPRVIREAILAAFIPCSELPDNYVTECRMMPLADNIVVLSRG